MLYQVIFLDITPLKQLSFQNCKIEFSAPPDNKSVVLLLLTQYIEKLFLANREKTDQLCSFSMRQCVIIIYIYYMRDSQLPS